MEDPGFRPIALDRLRIRRLRPEDAGAFAAYRSDPEVARYQGWQAPYSLAEARAFIAGLEKLAPGTPGRWFQFAVALADTDELIGDCALRVDASNGEVAEMGFSFARSHQGRGYAAEAVGAVVSYALEGLALREVRAITDARNQAAVRLLTRIGFRARGPLPESAGERLFSVEASEWGRDGLMVRAEQAADHRAVEALVAEAFGAEAEAVLVARLRAEAEPVLSLVATRGGAVAGHVLLSPVTLEGAGAPACAGLGPLAVAPDAQRRGIGARLVGEALERAPALGWRAVFLVGDPRYYARFGFRRAGPGFRYPNSALDPALQVVELAPGALKGQGGLVRFHPAFEEAEGSSAPTL